MPNKTENQYIQFRLLYLHCCGTLLCWVNPRRLNYCPECGENVFSMIPKKRWEACWSPAWLKVELPDKANLVTNMLSTPDQYTLRKDSDRDPRNKEETKINKIQEEKENGKSESLP